MIRPVVALLASFTVLLGVVYSSAITGIAQVAFPRAANGSAITVGGRVVGSSLLGQPFSDPRYFWPRPSATTPAYDASASSGSNLGPTSPELLSKVKERLAALRAADPSATGPVPVDLVAASGSGLDPDESPAAALFQVERVARARGLPTAQVRALVRSHVQRPLFGVFGAPRVNVLALNLALDRATLRRVDTGSTEPRTPQP